MNTHPMDYAAIEAQPGFAGNVYFLAPVNFENAAFCKIGRAKNDPEGPLRSDQQEFDRRRPVGRQARRDG